MIYLYFLIYHRLDANQTQFILLAFALGFTLDLLLQGAGGHTLSSITIATLRPQIFSLSFGSVLQETTKNLNQMLFYRQFYFSIWIVFLHHLIYFLVLFFSFSTFFIVLKQTLLTGIFTLTFLTVKQLFIGKKNGT